MADELAPWLSQNGVIRSTPLQQAAVQAATAVTSKGKGGDSIQSVGMPSSSNGPAAPGNAVSPKQVADAQQAAAQGDKQAIDWLAALGIGAGVAAGGGALAYALSRKKASGTPSSVAENVVGSVKTKNPATAVATRTPDVTMLKDWQEIPPDAIQVNGPQGQRLLEAYQGRVGSSVPAQAAPLPAPGQRYPVGPTNQQSQAEVAYMQKAAQDAKAAARAARTGQGSRKAAAYAAGEALRRVIP